MGFGGVNFTNDGPGFQAAINAAQPGDTITLQAGTQYSNPNAHVTCEPGNQFGGQGEFFLPAKANAGNQYIWIMSDHLANMPINTRANPNYGPVTQYFPSAHNWMPIIAATRTGDEAMCAVPGANYWVLAGIDFTSKATGGQGHEPWALGETLLLLYTSPPQGTGRRQVSVTAGSTTEYATASFNVDTPAARFDFWLQQAGDTNCTHLPAAGFGANIPSDGSPHVICFSGQNTHWQNNGSFAPVVTIGAQAVPTTAADISIGAPPTVINDTTMTASLTIQSVATAFTPGSLGIHFIHVQTQLPAGFGECAVSSCYENAWSEDPLTPVGSASIIQPALQAVCQKGTGPGTGQTCNNTLTQTTGSVNTSSSITTNGGSTGNFFVGSQTAPRVDHATSLTLTTNGIMTCTGTLPIVSIQVNGSTIGTIQMKQNVTVTANSWSLGATFDIPGTQTLAATMTTPGVGCTNLLPVTVKVAHQPATQFTVFGNASGNNATHFDFTDQGGQCSAPLTSTGKCSLVVFNPLIIPLEDNGICTSASQCQITLASIAGSGGNFFMPSVAAVVTGNNTNGLPGTDEVAQLFNAVYVVPNPTGCYISNVYPNHLPPGGSGTILVAQSEPAGGTVCPNWDTNAPSFNFNLGSSNSLAGASYTIPTDGGITVGAPTVDSAACVAAGYAAGYCATMNVSLAANTDQGSNHFIWDRDYIHGDDGDIKHCQVNHTTNQFTTGPPLTQNKDSRCYNSSTSAQTLCGQTVNPGSFYTCNAQLINIALQCESAYCGIIDTDFDEIMNDNAQESHGLFYSFNPGPITVANTAFNNVKTEQVFSGGTSGFSSRSFVNPKDIIYGDPENLTGFGPFGGLYVYRDFYYYPLCQKNLNSGQPPDFDCKNSLELKNAERVLYAGTWLQNSFNAAQASAYTNTPRTGANQGTVASAMSDVTYLNQFVKFVPNTWGFLDTDYAAGPFFQCTNAGGCNTGAYSQTGLMWGGFTQRTNFINTWVGAMDVKNFYDSNPTGTPHNYIIQVPQTTSNLYFSHNTWTNDLQFGNPTGPGPNGGFLVNITYGTCTVPVLTTSGIFFWDNVALPPSTATLCGGSGNNTGKNLLDTMVYQVSTLPSECTSGHNDSDLVRFSGNLMYPLSTAIPGCTNAPNNHPNSNFTTGFNFTTPSINTFDDNFPINLQLSLNPNSANQAQDWRANTHDGLQAGVNATRLVANILNVPAGTGVNVTTTSLAGATQGIAYNQSVFATLGALPLTWSASGLGSGPCTNLSINSSTGAITGTPNTAGNCVFTVTATDANSVQSSMPETIVVAHNTSPTITTNPVLPPGETAGSYSQQMCATGGSTPYTWTTGTLPTGLTLTSASPCMTISGTPSGYTSVTTVSFNVTVTDSLSNASSITASITVYPALTVTAVNGGFPGGEVGIAYSANLIASGGIPPYTYGVATGSMAVYPNTAFQGLQLCPSSTAGCTQGAGVIFGTPTTANTIAGTYTATDSAPTPVTATSGSLPIVVSATISINTTTMSNGHVGVAYSSTQCVTNFNICAQGGTGPYTWSATGLPCDNLSLDTSQTGLNTNITGTPSTAQVCSFSVTVTDSLAAHATNNLQISVLPVAAPLVITCPLNNCTLTPGIVGQFYQAQFAGSGGSGSYLWNVTKQNPPRGMTVNQTTGLLSGIPNPSVLPFQSSFFLTLSDTNGDPPVTKLIFLTINPTSGASVSPGFATGKGIVVH